MREKDIQNTENTGFLEAYDAYADDIFRFCALKVRDRDLAVDLTQDTFIKTWEYLQGKSVDNIRAFLYKVARNLIIDHARKKKADSLDELRDAGYDSGHDPTKRMEAEADADYTARMLDQLPDTYRDVLMMRYIDDMDISDIAVALDESENNVSVRIHRALKKAQEIFKSI